MNKKILKCFLFNICIIFLIFNINKLEAATTPTLVNKLYTALRRIKDYLVKLSTPTAAVAIASGVLIRKLSFGDEEKMIRGRKVIVNAIVGYGIILSIDLIIKFIESIL